MKKSLLLIAAGLPGVLFAQTSVAPSKPLSPGQAKPAAKPLASATPKPTATPLVLKPDTNPSSLKFTVKGLRDAAGRLDAPLNPWALPEAFQDVSPQEKQEWKAQKPGGSVEYLDKAPDPNAGYEKVWCVFKSPVHIMTHYIGLGTVDSTPRPVWGRMYWDPKSNSWGASHPDLLAFKDEESRAEWILENAAVAYGGFDVASAMRKPWYDLINISAGSAKTPEQKQKILQDNTAALQKLDMCFGQSTGLGDAFWNARKLSIAINERIHPETSPAQRLVWVQQRRAYLKQIVNTLCK